MANSPNFQLIFLILLFLSSLVVPPSNAQSSTLCTGAMIRSFNPCIGFLTGGGSGANSSPTSGCCSALKDLMSNGQDCLCLIVTGGVPFQIPVNRTLAISLPRACKMSGVPVECKGTAASPVPPPDSGSQGQDQPNLSPGLSPPSPTTGPLLPQPFTPPTPGGELTPPPDEDIIPTLTPPGMRPTLNPSAATSTTMNKSFGSSLVVIVLGVFIFMNLKLV
ncbi:non-specific lipid transfer protein GPI-anchored 21-like [Andrographis paniculata]|uniref:non-specific lipid transfer protein GPI-anchored 21-like n=1 Tax=Andrographis paniculata TaxID=175694 RepID=UPI0021E7CDCA|nr:non-specific lipid transfer protein GPI-anchored 21-like [Andrographis paniculata]